MSVPVCGEGPIGQAPPRGVDRHSPKLQPVASSLTENVKVFSCLKKSAFVA